MASDVSSLAAIVGGATVIQTIATVNNKRDPIPGIVAAAIFL